MSKLTLYLPRLSDIMIRYEDGDESIHHPDVLVVEDLPTAKLMVKNRLKLLEVELTKLKLKDIK